MDISIFNSKKNVNILLVVYTIAFLLLNISQIYNYKNFAFIIVLIAFVINITTALQDGIKQNIIFVCFHGCFFLFLLGKPLIRLANGTAIQIDGTHNGYYIFVRLLFVSLISLHCGRVFVKSRKYKVVEMLTCNEKIKILKQACMCVLCISFIVTVMVNIEKIIFIQDKYYLEYYTDFVTNLPRVLQLVDTFFIPISMIFLALLPNKKETYCSLLALIVGSIGSLVVGMRSPFILACGFSFMYLWVRQYYFNSQKEYFIGKREYIAIFLCIPLICSLLYAYVDIRNGSDTTEEKRNPVISLIDQQGISFDYMILAIDKKEQLQSKNEFPGYVMGPLYDALIHNAISRKILGTAQFSGQTLETLEHSHDMRMHASYEVLGDEFFDGKGIGGSYILDTYIDFGVIGVSIFSFLLGTFLSGMIYLFNRKLLVNYILLYALYEVLYLPRTNSALLFYKPFIIYHIIGVFLLYGTYRVLNVKKEIMGKIS